jgi:hypothetical protein
MTQKIENYENSLGQSMVAVYEGEIVYCYTKQRWDEIQAEQSTPMVTDEAATL